MRKISRNVSLKLRAVRNAHSGCVHPVAAALAAGTVIATMVVALAVGTAIAVALATQSIVGSGLTLPKFLIRTSLLET